MNILKTCDDLLENFTVRQLAMAKVGALCSGILLGLSVRKEDKGVLRTFALLGVLTSVVFAAVETITCSMSFHDGEFEDDDCACGEGCGCGSSEQYFADCCGDISLDDIEAEDMDLGDLEEEDEFE